MDNLEPVVAVRHRYRKKHWWSRKKAYLVVFTPSAIYEVES